MQNVFLGGHYLNAPSARVESTDRVRQREPLTKTLRVMKLTAFFLLVISMGVAAKSTSQTITFSGKEVTLERLFKIVEQQTGHYVLYRMELIKDIPPFSIDATNEPLTSFLTNTLKKWSLTYVIKNNTISIKKGESIAVNKPQSFKLEFAFFPIKGRVIDDKGNALTGAAVRVKQSDKSVTTDVNGNFTANANKGDLLVISHVGYSVRTVTVKDEAFINIKLELIDKSMEEVVVNGIQTIKEKMNTGSVVKLNAKDFLEVGTSSIDKMLQGKVPGLMVINNSGSPNAIPKLRIRGTSTFVGNAAPIWVVDDVIWEDPVDLTPTQLNNVVNNLESASYSIVGNAVSGINPNDIESITFLKDAAATAIYGPRSANGVIVLTTKKGKAGEPVLSYAASLNFQKRPSYNDLQVMNSKERVNLSREVRNDGGYITQIAEQNASYEGLLTQLYSRLIDEATFNARVAVLETANTDWFDLLFRNSINSTHSLALSGGTAKTRFYSSVSFADNKGIAKNDGNKNFSATLNVQSILSKKIDVNFRLGGSYSKAYGYYSVNPLAYATQTTRALPQDYFYTTGFSTPSMTYANGVQANFPLKYNTLHEIAHTENINANSSVNSGLTFNYKITENLRFQTVGGVQITHTEGNLVAGDNSNVVSVIRQYDLNQKVTPDIRAKSPMPFGGIFDLRNSSLISLNLGSSLDYGRRLFKGRDDLSLSVGYRLTSVTNKVFKTKELGYFPDRGKSFFSDMYNVGGLAVPGSVVHRVTYDDRLTNGIAGYASASYRLMDRYVFSATIRADGSNRFGQYSNSKFTPNYVVSGRWDIQNEPWMVNSRLISGATMSASYGINGNVVTSVSPQLIASFSTPPIDVTSGEYLLRTKTLPYPNLRWEKTHQINLRLAFAFFNGRVQIDANGYKKWGRDLITTLSLPYEYGVSQMFLNGSTMNNSGLELAMTITPYRAKHSSASISFSAGWNLNKITNISYQPTYQAYLSGNAYVPGKPVSAFWSFDYAGLDPKYGTAQFNNTEMPGGGHIKDRINVDHASYMVYSGLLEPPISLGISPSFSYKSFSISMNLYLAVGNHKRLNPLFPDSRYVPEPLTNAQRRLNQRFRNPGDEAHTDIPASNYGALVDGGSLIFPGVTGIRDLEAYDKSDIQVANGSFLRCKTINAGYAFPKSVTQRIGVKGMNGNLSIANPFLITSKAFRGQDPETEGVGTTALPVAKRISLGINVTF